MFLNDRISLTEVGVSLQALVNLMDSHWLKGGPREVLTIVINREGISCHHSV